MTTRNPALPVWAGAGSNTVVLTFAALSAGDDAAVIGPQYADHSERVVQVTGTWGGTTVTVEGSNDGSTWFTLNDAQGSAISKTVDFIEQVTECPLYMRIKSTGGAGATLVPVVLCRRS